MEQELSNETVHIEMATLATAAAVRCGMCPHRTHHNQRAHTRPAAALQRRQQRPSRRPRGVVVQAGPMDWFKKLTGQGKRPPTHQRGGDGLMTGDSSLLLLNPTRRCLR